MTEQLEDDFWAQERARAVAERGQQADPSACGTCKASVAAGGHVKHDECAQRATLLPAPDAPGYELITGMSEEEVWALPARFHTPAFIESSTPKVWVCAVCWGDGWSTQWPCKTATEQGLRVFTADDYAETRAKREAAELAEHRAEATTPLVVDRFDVAMEHAPEEEPGLTIGAIAENGRPVALVFDEETRAKVAGWLAPAAEPVKIRQKLDSVRANRNYWRDRYRAESRTTWSSEVPPGGEVCADCGEPVESEPCREHNPTALVDQLRAEVQQWRATYGRDALPGALAQMEQLRSRVAELEAERKKYVGAEPTIAEEMAYLSRCIDSVLDLCTAAEQQATLWENPLPVPAWVAEIRKAAEGLAERRSYPPALPWAALMDDEDLAGFLRDLDAGMRDSARQAHFAGRPQAPAVLVALEQACGRWRAIAEAQHAHNTAAGPNANAEAGEGR